MMWLVSGLWMCIAFASHGENRWFALALSALFMLFDMGNELMKIRHRLERLTDPPS